MSMYLKVKCVFRIVAAVFFVLGVMCGSAYAERFSDLGVRVKDGVFRIRDGIVFGLILKKSSNSFFMLCDLAEAYITETENLFFGEVVKSSGFREDNGELSALDRIELQTAYEKGRLYIDRSGAVHLAYDETEGAFDITLDISGFQDYADRLLQLFDEHPSAPRRAVTLLLYDSKSSMFSVLVGGNEDLKAELVLKSTGEKTAARLGLRYLMLTKPVDLENADLIFLGFYPYGIGRETVYTFGLIAIVILTILVLWLTVSYAASGFKPRGVQTMGDIKKDQDIIDEIDQELSTVKEKKVPADVQTAEKVEKEESGKQLKDDGIFIEK